jgi:hypothetical protein
VSFFPYLIGGRIAGAGKISIQKKLRTTARSPMMTAMMAITGIFDCCFFAV